MLSPWLATQVGCVQLKEAACVVLRGQCPHQGPQITRKMEEMKDTETTGHDRKVILEGGAWKAQIHPPLHLVP